MSRIRIWTAGLVSRVDGMVSRIENHEAVAQSAIAEVRAAAARASVRLRQVRADGARQRERLAALRESEAGWRERARRRADDEATALECLRRSRRDARRAADLADRVREHERVEKQLAADVATVEERLLQLEAQHHVLATRQSRAEALRGAQHASAPFGSDLQEIFGRWEVQVAEREFAGGCFDAGDALEEDFDREEEEASLRAELDALARTDDDGKEIR